jgi:hypothetical protein
VLLATRNWITSAESSSESELGGVDEGSALEDWLAEARFLEEDDILVTWDSARGTARSEGFRCYM